MDVIELMRWAAAILTIVAALSVAWGEPPRLVAWGFILFTAASILWITAASMEGKWALIVQNVVLFGVNVWGVWRWWRRV
jgi:uncharacterized membrane protein YphA (DoxX/SURF4 family)